jgi:hypothetical protein
MKLDGQFALARLLWNIYPVVCEQNMINYNHQG